MTGRRYRCPRPDHWRRSGPPSARSGDLQIERVGFRQEGLRDLYHGLMVISIPALLLLLAFSYLAVNALFAGIYLLFDGAIANARPGSFEDAFFFSVQTMATIGYGVLSPQTLAGNILVTIETVIGMLTLALSTGVLFARVSRPTARMTFSRVAVIGTFNGRPTLMLRVANRRRNQIVEAQMSLAVLREETTLEGLRMRRFHDLTLARNRTPVFALTWMVLHHIDEESPLYGVDSAQFAAGNMAIVCAITGLDETFMQMVHTRHTYGPGDLRWRTRFVDIIGERADGRRVIDYTRFHDTVD